jgi:cytochrome c peroxidase
MFRTKPHDEHRNRSPNATLPFYLIQCNEGTQAVTTDPGRAMVTGNCADIGKFKVPGMRGLAARRTSTNGSSATLMDVVNFYDQRFNMLLTDQEKADLVAFINTCRRRARQVYIRKFLRSRGQRRFGLER